MALDKQEVPTITLRVKSNVPIPHRVAHADKQSGGQITYQFNPDCAIPEEYAEDLLRTYPHIFMEAKGRPDLRKYKVRDSYARMTFDQLFKKLDVPHQQKGIDLLKNLLHEQESEETEEGPDTEEVPETEETPKGTPSLPPDDNVKDPTLKERVKRVFKS